MNQSEVETNGCRRLKARESSSDNHDECGAIFWKSLEISGLSLIVPHAKYIDTVKVPLKMGFLFFRVGHFANTHVRLGESLHSPRGHYFATASHDRTARLWSTDHPQPLRILAGHVSDVNVRVLPIFYHYFLNVKECAQKYSWNSHFKTEFVFK